MLELTKLARWALPGGAAIAWLLGGLQLQRLIAGTAFALRPVVSSGVGVAIATIASVPLGFLVYQLYSHGFNNPVLFLDVVHKDVARRALDGTNVLPNLASGYRDRRINGVRVRGRVILGAPWLRIRTYWLWDDAASQWLTYPDRTTRRRALASYYRQRERNWTEVEWSLTRYKPKVDFDLTRAFVEIDRLSEIYHTLGATRAGLVLGTAMSAAIGAATVEINGNTGNWHGFWIGQVAMTAVTVYVYKVIQDNRAHSLDRRTTVMNNLLLSLTHP